MHLHSDLPQHEGERQLAERLINFPDSQGHLWFSVQALPGVPDIDILLLHEDAGLFVIEVKAVRMKDVESFGYDTCTIRGRGRRKSPQLQAHDAMRGLRNFFHDMKARLEFVVPTVCWPRIERSEWLSRRMNDGMPADFTRRMLFHEDLGVSPDLFLERLQYIYTHPPIRGAPQRPFVHHGGLLKTIENTLNPKRRPQPTMSDLERLRIIETDVAREARHEAPIGVRRQLIYRGYPGTGKTFRLLQIAYWHAQAGEQVLFACFNKVLATDLRRLMAFSEGLVSHDGRLDIWHVDGLLSNYSSLYPRRDGEADLGYVDQAEWARMVFDDVRQHLDGGIYDTVLIDEGQDMREWAFEFCAWLARPDATLAVAIGEGQALYGPEARWLTQFAANAATVRLKQNFRNRPLIFQFADVIHTSGFDTSAVPGAADRWRDRTPLDGLTFLRDHDALPRIHYIDDSRFEGRTPFHTGYESERRYLMVEAYEKLLHHELDTLREEEWPIDLLILVPAADSREKRWMVEAAGRFRENHDLIDYTDPDQRRTAGDDTSIRLSTYHSSRGIEGSRVIVLGLEHAEGAARAARVPLETIAYVALSRAIADNVLVFPTSARRTDAVRTVEDALRALHNQRRPQ